MGHAKAIAGAPAEEQLRLLKSCVKKGLSVRQAEEAARTLAESAGQAPHRPRTRSTPKAIRGWSSSSNASSRRRSRIKRSKKGGGKITIDFADDTEIERFIERFPRR